MHCNYKWWTIKYYLVGFSPSAKKPLARIVHIKTAPGCPLPQSGPSMTVSFRVYKKSSNNGRVTLYLGRRDYVDHVTGSDPVDGVVNIDQEFLNDKRVVVQLVCSFR